MYLTMYQVEPDHVTLTPHKHTYTEISTRHVLDTPVSLVGTVVPFGVPVLTRLTETLCPSSGTN